MKENRKISYLALMLGGVLCIGAASAAITPAYSRYTSVTGWQLELKQELKQVSSDVLDSEGSVVRLADMYVDEESRDVQVNLEFEQGSGSGTLDCRVSNSYLTAVCLETVEEENFPRFTVQLSPTEQAQSLTEKTETTIEVVWDENLWAILAVTLIPLEEGIEPIESDEELEPTEETEETLPEAVNFLSAMSGFDPTEYLAVSVVVPESCDQIILDLDGGEFPAFTRYSIDGGEHFTLLYDSAWITLEPNGVHMMSVLLDFENVKLFGDEVTVSADAYNGEQWRGASSATVAVLEPMPELAAQENPIVISEDVALVLSVPQNIGGASLSFYLRRLDGTTDEIPTIAVDPASGQTYIEAVSESHRAKAGTYLLDMNWTYQGAIAVNRQIAFYVNYSLFTPASGQEATEGTAAEQVTDPNENSEPTQATTIGGSET